jgi:hypothetical protein
MPASVRNAESALTSKLAKLHVKPRTRLTAPQLKALGLKPDPSWLAAKFKHLAHSTGARVADQGATRWFTYDYYGPFWANVAYDGPYLDGIGRTYYGVFSNYVMCDAFATVWQAAVPDGHTCIDLNAYSWTTNTEINGSFYYWDSYAFANTPDSDGLPIYGDGPFPG